MFDVAMPAAHSTFNIRHSTFRLYNPPVSIPLFFALYCLEAGLFFTIVPWTRVWTMNPLLHNNLAIGVWMDNPFVPGFGVVHLIIGVNDIIRLNAERRRSGAA